MFYKTFQSYSLRTLHLFVLLTGSILAAAPSLNNFCYKAAAVLPVYTQNNRLYVILSREAHGRDKGTYDSFGGSRDAHEHNPTITAARECAEEAISHKTMGLSAQALAHHIDPYRSSHTMFVFVSKQTQYALFMTRFDRSINRFISNFYKALHTTTAFKYKEKDRIAGIPWDALAHAIYNTKGSTHVTVNATVFDPRGARFNHQERIKLRPILVKMLRPYFENHSFETDAHKPKTIRFYA